jgi:hypothetical protein
MDKKKIFKAWTFFRRGHGVYLVFIMSFMNFLVIQWRLLFEKVVILDAIFQRFYIFTLAFLACYVPFAVFIGWLDYRKGSVPVDLSESAKSSPYNKDMAKAIISLANGENQRVEEIMRKWM